MIDAVKISVIENDVETRTFIFSELELKNFAHAISDMADEGKKIDLEKAAHNAKYFAEIDRRIAEMDKAFSGISGENNV